MFFKKRSPNAEKLIAKMHAGPSAHLREAFVALGSTGVDAALTYIRKGKNARVRAELVRALGEIGDLRASKGLIRAMSDDDEDVADEACEALYLLGEVEPLLKELSASGPGASLAIGVLARFGKRAVPGLIERLTRANAQTRERAAEALGEIGDGARHAKDALQNARADKDPQVAREAERALRRIWK